MAAVLLFIGNVLLFIEDVLLFIGVVLLFIEDVLLFMESARPLFRCGACLAVLKCGTRYAMCGTKMRYWGSAFGSNVRYPGTEPGPCGTNVWY